MLFSAAATEQPIQFGPYLLTECVGQGGMAVVYKAVRHGPSGFEKTVVIKAMLPSLSAQREFVAMFSAEARLMAQLTHPNIVQVHDFGVVDGIPFLAMEYLPGRNLSQLRVALQARGQTLPVGAALAVARDMCLGLGYAHDFVDSDGRKRQIIHRDVSPSNVMVCRDGSVKLLDFGVAKIVGEFEFDVTQSFKGKYAYMAPEQVNHHPIDRRVDVFAAGVVLHELLTGKRLFAAATELETLQRVSAAQVIAPSVDNREVPRALDAIVKKALARDPVDRYGSGSELAEALEKLDALAWSRKRLAALVAELFADDWVVVCEVCGKQVTRGEECRECGTAAPETAPPSVDAGAERNAVSARQALLPILNAQETERNVIDAPMAPLPPGVSEPLPLPPPPARPAARPRLAVVRTPLPPRAAEAAAAPWTRPPTPAPIAPAPIAPAPVEPEPVLEAAELPPPIDPAFVAAAPLLPPADPEPTSLERVPAPPRLFVVPRPSSVETPSVTPLPPPSPLLTPRPASPQPLFAMPPAAAPMEVPELRQSRATLVLAMAGALLLLIVAVALAVHKATLSEERAAAAAAMQAEPTAAPTPTPLAARPVAPTPEAAATPTPPAHPAATPTTASPAADEPAAAAATAASPAADEPAADEPTAAPAPAEVAPPAASEATPPARPAPSRAAAPSHRSHHRSRAHAASAPAAEPERTIKDGRIVDPFAGMN